MMVSVWVVHCLLILLSVAFFTLFERKVMGLFHNRLGPNKVFFFGLVQPLLDAFKLLSKQNMTPIRVNKMIYNMSPQFSLFLAFFSWIAVPSIFNFFSLNFSFLMFFCVSSIMVFCVLFSGWSSNSKYSLIGSLRSVAQSISYESVLSTILVLLCLLIGSYSIQSFMEFSSLIYLVILPLWFVCILAETHRAPFDFSESESELVSGFNTEYSGAYFAFIFLSEYAMVLLSCLLISFIYFFWILWASSLVVIGFSIFISFVFIWVRITFCRFRYDLLMMFAWKIALPLSLMGFIIFMFII